MSGAVGRARFWIALSILVLLHFAARPRLADPRWAPDFVFAALVLLAVCTRPRVGAAAGLVTGLLMDALAPTAFGAAALAFTIVGYGAGWVRALFVTDNALVTALVVLAAAWARDIIQVLASNQLVGGALVWQLFAWSPLAAAATAAAALAALLLFRGWLAPSARS